MGQIPVPSKLVNQEAQAPYALHADHEDSCGDERAESGRGPDGVHVRSRTQRSQDIDERAVTW